MKKQAIAEQDGKVMSSLSVLTTAVETTSNNLWSHDYRRR